MPVVACCDRVMRGFWPGGSDLLEAHAFLGGLRRSFCCRGLSDVTVAATESTKLRLGDVPSTQGET